MCPGWDSSATVLLVPSSGALMAGQWEDWFEREEFIGQISDMRVQNLQGRRGSKGGVLRL